MILLSWLFLAVAIGTLVAGVFISDALWLIYVSIGASALAMIFLIAGILRRRPVQPATAGAPYGPPPEEAAERGRVAATATAPPAAPSPAPPPPERRPAPVAPAATEEAPVLAEQDSVGVVSEPADEVPAEAAPAEETAPLEPEPAPATTRKRTTTRKPAAKKTTAKTPAAKTSTAKTSTGALSTRSMVVAIPERGTFHRPTCRWVQNRDDTERMQLGTASNRGFSACGTCKPQG